MYILERIVEDPDFITESELKTLYSVIDGIYAIPADAFEPQYIIPKAQKFLNERRVKPAIIDDIEDVENKLQIINKAYEESRINTGNEINLFTPGKEIFEAPPKTEIGFEPVDVLIGGGISDGEVYGMLGPSGGGKTTLAAQLVCMLGKKHIRSAYFEYENPVCPEISRRFYGFIGGIPRTVVQATTSLTDFKEDSKYLKQLRQAEEEYARDYIIVQDMKDSQYSGTGGIAEIKALLREYDKKNRHISFIALNQFLPMVHRYMSAHNIPLESRRTVMQTFVGNLMDIGSDMGCSFLLLHQTSTDYKNAAPIRKPKQGESAEDRSFDNWMPYCLSLGTTDEKGCCWLVNTKRRNTKGGEYIILLNGEHYRFEYHPDRFCMAGNKFIDTRDTEDSYSPSSVISNEIRL
jgi:hypothetical protein